MIKITDDPIALEYFKKEKEVENLEYVTDSEYYDYLLWKEIKDAEKKSVASLTKIYLIVSLLVFLGYLVYMY